MITLIEALMNMRDFKNVKILPTPNSWKLGVYSLYLPYLPISLSKKDLSFLRQAQRTTSTSSRLLNAWWTSFATRCQIHLRPTLPLPQERPLPDWRTTRHPRSSQTVAASVHRITVQAVRFCGSSAAAKLLSSDTEYVTEPQIFDLALTPSFLVLMT